MGCRSGPHPRFRPGRRESGFGTTLGSGSSAVWGPIPAGSVITTINGAMTPDAKSLLRALEVAAKTRRVLVEYVTENKQKAREFLIAR